MKNFEKKSIEELGNNDLFRVFVDLYVHSNI